MASRKHMTTRLLALAGVLVSAAGLLLHLFFTGVSSQQIETNVQKDFLNLLAETESSATQILADFREGELLPEDPRLVRLMYDNDCHLVQWTNPERMPQTRILKDLCNFPERRTIPDKNKVFYLLRSESETHKLVTLIPVHISYKVENAFLPTYVYLGRYQDDPNVTAVEIDIDVELKQVEGAIKVFDEVGNFVYCMEVPKLEVFSYAMKDRVIFLLGLGLLLLMAAWYRWLEIGQRRRNLLGVRPVFLFLGSVLLLRALLFWTGFPSVYRPYELFSPGILAINRFSPSLGDLLLNVGIFLLATWLLIREYRRWISRFFKWALRKETLAWTVQCFTLTLCAGFTWTFFRLTESTVRHSTIYFEYSNLFELDLYSYLAFIILACFLITLQLILLELLRFSFHFFKGNGRLYKVLLSLAFLGGLSFLFFGFQPAYLISVPFVFGLSLLVFVRTKRTLVFQLDLLNFLILISIFSLLTTIGMVEGGMIRNSIEMERLADRQSDQHDLITESLFERVVQDIEAESFLLDYREADGLSNYLKENFFDSNFKGYQVRLYVYDDSLKLLDRTSSIQAYQPTDASFSLEKLGRRTMTENLVIAPYYSGITGSIYIGEFDILLRSLGNIRVLVELEPTEFQSNRLYPQLLLDDHVRQRAMIAEGFDYGIYEDGKLSRKHGNAPFPFFLQMDSEGDSANFGFRQEAGYYSLFNKLGGGKVVQVRTPLRSLFDSANLFSFIFYFFILGSIALMFPVWLVRFIREPGSLLHLSLKAKIQVFFLSIAIVPLFVVLFLISPFVKGRIYEDLRAEVQEETTLALNLLRDDYLRLWRQRTEYRSNETLLLGRLQEMEKTILHDLNIFYSNGRLHLTTQPSIYELGLTSQFMNPAVFQALQQGRVSDMVVEEKIGNITYFSSFYPILSNEPRIMGILNIPYYKNQDQVNEQSLNLLTLLVNIYVFIFLAIGIVGVLISNSITRPLGLLNRQLRITNLGRRNEPIEWDARDEIGEIIEAYNQMLAQLEESKEKLAKNEREMAWKGMARQVAHEIKNPLTPMRLSVQHLVQVWKMKKPDNEKLNQLFDKVTGTVLVQIEQLVNIANSFSQYATMPEAKRSTFPLREVVEEVYNLYSHSEEVQLKLHVQEGEFLVHSDRDQLSRVFNNLIKNAIQAIEHKQGAVEVRMLYAGDEAWVEVQDNGKGVPEAIRERIFEPRFSTKSSGMGLGLAMVKKIVEGAGGRIYFETMEGKGTTFFVALPRAASEQ